MPTDQHEWVWVVQARIDGEWETVQVCERLDDCFRRPHDGDPIRTWEVVVEVGIPWTLRSGPGPEHRGGGPGEWRIQSFHLSPAGSGYRPLPPPAPGGPAPAPGDGR